MQYEARGLLEEYSENVVRDAINVVQKHYTDLPPEAQAIVATERAEGKLDGMYTMWLVANDAEREEDSVGVINDIVSQYSRAIESAFI